MTRSISDENALFTRTWPGPRDRPPIVLLHALGGSSAHWLGVAPRLARLGSVLAVDLAGHGRSSARGGVSLEANRDRLDALLERIGASVLIGSSFGGGVAALQAARRPDSVRALVLTGSMLPLVPGPGRRRGLIARRLRQRATDLASVARAIRDGRLRRGRMEEFLLRGNLAVPEALDPAVVAEILADPGPDGARRLATTIAAGLSSLRLVAGGSTLEQVFDAIAAPVLVIHGGRDRTVPASQAAAVAERRPDWRVEILADLGHLPHLEEPDRWCGLVEAWWPLTAPS